MKNPHDRDARISFEPVEHKYTIDADPDKAYTSVTTWIHTHFREFDTDGIIKRMMASRNWKQSQYYGMTADAIKAACFEHHESWTGNGYPQNISGQEIHPFGRIVAIADTYDAMTTQRSYNIPLKPLEAVTMMKEKISGRYDPDMLKALHSVLFKLKAAS